jgi:hypothetical protein
VLSSLMSRASIVVAKWRVQSSRKLSIELDGGWKAVIGDFDTM